MTETALLTTKEAAEILKLSPGTLRNWRSTNPDRLPPRRNGRTIRYDRSVVMAFFEKRDAA